MEDLKNHLLAILEKNGKVYNMLQIKALVVKESGALKIKPKDVKSVVTGLLADNRLQTTQERDSKYYYVFPSLKYIEKKAQLDTLLDSAKFLEERKNQLEAEFQNDVT